jgi:phosphatidylserine/phosphatidylglycerophosphate/cardiolipin synthase-like enzyme
MLGLGGSGNGKNKTTMETVRTIIGAEYPKKVIPLIDGAKRSILMCMFEWRWYKDDFSHPVSLFNSALLRAHRRGVKVRILTNYVELIEFVTSLGFNAKKWPDKSLLHSKFLIIDGEKCVIGSHNITQSAFTSNMETSIILDDPDDILRFSNYFEMLWLR